jgi:hypothetical protein
VRIANSDERIIALAAGWLAALSDRSLRCSVQYHADQDLTELRDYWGDVLGIDGATISVLRKSNSSQLKGRWIDRLRQDWSLDSATKHGV